MRLYFFKSVPIIKKSLSLTVLLFFATATVFALDIPRYESTHVVGGTGLEWGVSIAKDALGNLYHIGQFSSPTIDLNPGVGVDTFVLVGSADIFLTKYNPDGTYAWSKVWGGTGGESIYNIAFDSTNNIYIATEFTGTVDLDPGVGIDSYVSAGSTDMALVKINANGTYGGSKVMGGTGPDRLHTVQVDSSDNLYIAGKFRTTVDFDPSIGVDNHTSLGDYDAFLTKFNPNGTYAWTKVWGSTGRDTVNDMSLDSNNNIYLAGVFRGTTDFDTSAGTDNYTSNGLDDAALTKYNADGTYAWTRTWGSTNNDFSFNIGVSPSNDVYIVGSFALTVDFDPSIAINNIASVANSEDSYVSKFESDGTYDFTYTWGGALQDQLYSVTFDADGKWYVGGFFSQAIDLDPTAGVDTASPNGTFDQFFSVFNADDTYVLSKTFGTPTEINWFDEIVYELYVSGDTLYVTGNFINTTDFNPEVGVDSFTSAGSWDVYYATYSLAVPGVTLSPTSNLITTEAGGTATTSIVLSAKPVNTVTIPISSSNVAEGTVSLSSVIFTTSNWNIPQIITITGVDDAVVDGNILYSLITGSTTSLDPGYNILGNLIADVSLTNTDNDTASVSMGGGMYRLGGCVDPLAVNFERYATYQFGMCIYSALKPVLITIPVTPEIKVTDIGVCAKYITITERIAFGKKNDLETVKKIQTHLNTYEKESLVIDGVYKNEDVTAVKRFQEKYKNQILGPWGFSSATGIVAVTTAAKINSVVCAQAVECPYFEVLSKLGDTNNDVPRIKSFLNIVMNTNLDTSSFLFDQQTSNAVKLFQTKYNKFVLRPWNLKQATGLWYQTSIRQANTFMGCSVSSLTLPNGAAVE